MELSIKRLTIDEISNEELQVVTSTSPYEWDKYGDDSIYTY